MRFGAQNSRGKISVHPSGRHSNKISLLRVVESAPLTNALEVYPTLFHMNGGSIITLSSSFVCSPNAPDTQWPRRKTSNCHWHQCCRPSHVRADTYLIVQFDKKKEKKKKGMIYCRSRRAVFLQKADDRSRRACRHASFLFSFVFVCVWPSRQACRRRNL